MPTLGPQQFEVDLSDQLFRTYNPADPIIGISVTATVPVIIPWNLARSELEKDKDVIFGFTRWSGAGAGPHDVYVEKLGGLKKIGTVTWSIDTTCYKTVQGTDNHHRWLITPCPILSRTFTPLSGAPQIVEVMKNPQACPGIWIDTPSQITALLANSLEQDPLPISADDLAKIVGVKSSPATNSAKTKPKGK
jgi:hypothetical protein